MDDVVGLADELVDARANLRELLVAQPQLEHRLLHPVAPPLQIVGQAGAAAVVCDVVGHDHRQRHDTPTQS